jgi:DNA/RNA-binding domain of Phe-tRNA-synthetase-like protein
MKLNHSVKEKFPDVVVGYAIARGVKVQKTAAELEETKRRALEELKAKYGAVPTADIPQIKVYRNFHRMMGVDPSKFRPAVEYLLRRALEGRFPSISNLVDLCLLATVQHWVVVGAYDLDKIVGEPTVTLGAKIETFELIDGRKVTPLVNEIILRDAEKIISAYTAGDAKSTMIASDTKNALIVVWNAPGIDRENVNAALANIKDGVQKFCQAKIEESGVLT